MIDVPAIVLAEHAENEVRKEFTKSERVAIAQAIEAELGNRQGQRTDLKTEGQEEVPVTELPENFPEVRPGQETRQAAAKKARFGNETTYRQAKTVVTQGTPGLVGAMDQGAIAVSTAAKLAAAPVEVQYQAVADPKAAIELAKALGVSQSTVSNWLARTLKEEKERKRDKAFAMWQACCTQEEIATAVEVTRQAVAVWEEAFAKKLAIDNFANFTDFTPPIYNVWKQQDKTAGVKHFGNSEVRWLENLLYLYTNPADVIVSIPSHRETMRPTAELPSENWVIARAKVMDASNKRV